MSVQGNILVLNGPNVGIVGWRLPEVYGDDDIHAYMDGLVQRARDAGVGMDVVFSNHEGDLVDACHRLGPGHPGAREAVIVNPGGCTAYGVALRSALQAIARYTVLVHISNKPARTDGEHHRRDVIAPVSQAQIAGLGLYGYDVALDACVRHFEGLAD